MFIITEWRKKLLMKRKSIIALLFFLILIILITLGNNKGPLHEKSLIYYRYHEEFEECYWIDDEHVVINGKEIDIANKKTWVYDEEGDY